MCSRSASSTPEPTAPGEAWREEQADPSRGPDHEGAEPCVLDSGCGGHVQPKCTIAAAGWLPWGLGVAKTAWRAWEGG
jgi:hypothetical protein